jgi:hypothetical protein
LLKSRGIGSNGDGGGARGKGEEVFIEFRRCCTPEAYWNSNSPIDTAETPKMMRLKTRVEVFVSKSEVEDDAAKVYKKADAQKTMENQKVVKEDENCSLAQITANKVIREVCTAPC